MERCPVKSHEIKVGAKVTGVYTYDDNEPGTIMVCITTNDGSHWWLIAPSGGESNPPRWQWHSQGQLEKDRYKLFKVLPKVGDLVCHNSFKTRMVARPMVATFQGASETWAVVNDIGGKGYECFKLEELRVAGPAGE